MKMDIKRFRELFYKAYNHAPLSRENAYNDMMFYFLSHWDGEFLSGTTLPYRGQFDVLKKALRHTLTDLSENPVQVDFHPIDPERKDAAELADGLYRTDDHDNMSIEAYENAKQEACVCGVGAWKLYTEYESLRSGAKHQVIKRSPIFEANTAVYWDPSSKLIDKSDAKHVFLLTPYSEDGYKELIEDLTGGQYEDITPSSFESPKTGAFTWYCSASDTYYVAEGYFLKTEKTKILTMSNPFGEETELRESDLKDVMDDMLDEGFKVVSSKTIQERRVTKYIVSGDQDILWSGPIVGPNLPIVPLYGEHAYIDGQEHWEGMVRLAKDPQRLRNAILSYISDIAFRSPRPKPIFLPEQIKGFEAMYEAPGAENNFPYALMNRVAEDGNPLPVGPVALMPEQTVPQSLMLLVDASRQAVEDVANPGVPQDVADPDMSGKAIYAIQARMDMQSAVYQLHYKHSKRRDAQVWAGMAVEIYDVPKSAMITKPDGTKVQTKILEHVFDKKTGDIKVLNDMSGAEFEIYSEIGPAYSSQKAQTIERMTLMIQGMDPGDPMRQAMQLKVLEMTDGVNMDDIRENAKKQLILKGFKKPGTDEEIAMLEEAKKQQPEISADMVMAQAEQGKAQAMQMHEQIMAQQMQLDAQIKQKQIDVDVFNAQTKRMEAEIKAQEADAKITQTDVVTYGKHIENTTKVKDLNQPSQVV
jgi:hypothetical protein